MFYNLLHGLIVVDSIHFTQISQPHAAKHVVDDDDPIVDNNEIDTNNNLDSEWAISISRTYRSVDLRKWRSAPIVQSVYGRPGEMGNSTHILYNRKQSF